MSLATTAPSYVTGQVVTAAQLNALQDGIQAAWTAWTPTWTNLTIGNAVVNAKWSQIGKMILVRFDVLGGTTTAATGAVSSSLPVASHAAGNQILTGGYAATASGIAYGAIAVNSTTMAWNYAAPALTAVTVLGNAQAWRVQGTYEAA